MKKKYSKLIIPSKNIEGKYPFPVNGQMVNHDIRSMKYCCYHLITEKNSTDTMGPQLVDLIKTYLNIYK